MLPARRAGPGAAEPRVPGFLPIAQGDTDFSLVAALTQEQGSHSTGFGSSLKR